MILKHLKEYNKILILPILLLCLGLTPTFAQSPLSIGVSPTYKVLKVKPGGTYSEELVFWNLSQSADTYNIYVRSFKQIENQPGTAVILTEEEDSKALYSASKWVTIDKESLFLEPNKNTKLKYTINVPLDITNGEYNTQIFLISQSAPQQQGTVTYTNLAAGTPILLQVGDEFVESAELLRFVTDKKTYEKVDVDLITQIKNLGDTHITPAGEIVIENIFKQEVARVPFNRNRQSLLRDNLGNYIDNWSQQGYLSPSKKIALGPLKAKLFVTYRSFQPRFAVLTEETTFWIIPWKLILAILLILLTAIIVRASKRRMRKK